MRKLIIVAFCFVTASAFAQQKNELSLFHAEGPGVAFSRMFTPNISAQVAVAWERHRPSRTSSRRKAALLPFRRYVSRRTPSIFRSLPLAQRHAIETISRHRSALCRCAECERRHELSRALSAIGIISGRRSSAERRSRSPAALVYSSMVSTLAIASRTISN